MSLKKHIEKFDELHPEYVENTNYTDKLFAPVEELENRIYDRDGIIENLEEEILELKNQISILEKEKSNIVSRYSTWQDLGAALGPILGYIIASYYGINYGYILSIVLIFICLNLYIKIFKEE